MSNTLAFTFEGSPLSILGDVLNPLFIVLVDLRLKTSEGETVQALGHE